MLRKVFQTSLYRTLECFFLNRPKALFRYVYRPIATKFDPYIKVGYDGLTSDTTQRFALNTAIFTTSMGIMLAIASVIYGIFYLIYIPQVSHIIPVYMQYGSALGESVMPHAVVDFSGLSRQQIAYLTPEQHYDFTLELNVPDSTQNLELGNFMVQIELQSYDNKTTAMSSRPCALTYKSPLLRTMLTVWKSIPLLFGFAKEAQTVQLLLLEKYEENEIRPIQQVRLQLSDPRIQLYRTSLHVEANFQGLRFFMYHWRTTTAIVFISVFMFWEALFAFTLWSLALSLFNQDLSNEDRKVTDIVDAVKTKLESTQIQEDELHYLRDGGEGSADRGGASAQDEMDIYDEDRSNSSRIPHSSSPRSTSSAPSYFSSGYNIGSPPLYNETTVNHKEPHNTRHEYDHSDSFVALAPPTPQSFDSSEVWALPASETSMETPNEYVDPNNQRAPGDGASALQDLNLIP
ncbi:putative adipose-regulatory protein-domain-containing protein [Phlyctochytrium arcticum]|nr:putative adipose-regulatory protein-domain-containing protein [Phlyctochytrium arcticum]